jgi:Fe-S cluster assembly scaffold protein SufB
MTSAVAVRLPEPGIEMTSRKTSHNFWQIDHQIKSSEGINGVTVLPSPQAYRQLPWTRKHFGEKPAEGYFVWVQESPDRPLSTCLTIASSKISQNLSNLLVVEPGVEAEAGVVCNAAKPDLGGAHRARGKMVLKEGAQLIYRHVHRWGHGDLVSPDYQFILGKDAQLSYRYQNLKTPKRLDLRTSISVGESASCNLEIVIDARSGSRISVKDSVHIKGDGGRGVVRLRLVGREGAKIKSISRMVAVGAGTGHLDCQGLLLGKNSEISFLPGVVCRHPQAQVTHEASVGKLSEEALTYLRSRGLTEKEAVDLIVSGFLS